MWDKASFDRFYNYRGEAWGRPASRPSIRVHYNDFIVGDGQRRLSANLMSVLGMTAGANTIVIGAGYGWTVEGMVAAGVNAVGTDISTWVLAEKNNSEEADLRGYIAAAGVDPDTDEIIGPPNHPLATLKIPQRKQDDFDAYIVSAEADRRRAEIAWWEGLTEGERDELRATNPGFTDYAPKMPTGPKPEWMIKPLDLLMTRTDGKRTSATVMDEDASSVPSRRTIAEAIGGSPDFIVTEEVLNSISDAEGLTLCDHLASLASRHGGIVYHALSPLQPDTTQAPELNWKSYGDWRRHLDDNGFAAQGIVPTRTVGAIQRYQTVL